MIDKHQLIGVNGIRYDLGHHDQHKKNSNIDKLLLVGTLLLLFR